MNIMTIQKGGKYFFALSGAQEVIMFVLSSGLTSKLV